MTFNATIDPVSTMNEEMQEFAIDTAILSIIKHCDNKYEMAKYIKNKFDIKYGTNWAVMVGDDYRAFFTYEEKCYTVFKIQNFKFIIFKEL